MYIYLVMTKRFTIMLFKRPPEKASASEETNRTVCCTLSLLGDARPEPAEMFFQQPNAKKKTPRLSGVECLVYSKSWMAYKLRINMALA